MTPKRKRSKNSKNDKPFISIDELVKQFEQDPAMKRALDEARRWIREGAAPEQHSSPAPTYTPLTPAAREDKKFIEFMQRTLTPIQEIR